MAKGQKASTLRPGQWGHLTDAPEDPYPDWSGGAAKPVKPPRKGSTVRDPRRMQDLSASR